MKIGIYGGSFNPIHKGHVEIAKEAIKELNLDKLYFVPAYKTPFKSNFNYAPVEDRIEMINLVKPEKSEVSLFEAKRKGVSYTIDTVKYFKQKYPSDELYMIIGSDNVSKLNKWRDINDISAMLRIVVFKRNNNFSKINIKRYKATLLNNKIYEFASTDLREGNLENSEDNVVEYISSKYLYAEEILRSMVDAKRNKHSLATAAMAAELARNLKINSKKAYYAGLMHDITKGKPKEWHREFLSSKGVDESKLMDYQLHSLSAFYWLKDDYKMKDEEFLNSIRVHTSLEKELSKLDKVIYAADKLADGRKWKGIQDIRKGIREDFNKWFKVLVSQVRENIIETRGTISDEQEAIYKEHM